MAQSTSENDDTYERNERELSEEGIDEEPTYQKEKHREKENLLRYLSPCNFKEGHHKIPK